MRQPSLRCGRLLSMTSYSLKQSILRAVAAVWGNISCRHILRQGWRAAPSLWECHLHAPARSFCKYVSSIAWAICRCSPDNYPPNFLVLFSLTVSAGWLLKSHSSMAIGCKTFAPVQCHATNLVLSESRCSVAVIWQPSQCSPYLRSTCRAASALQRPSEACLVAA